VTPAAYRPVVLDESPEHEHGPVGPPQVDHLDRPQGDRQELHDHLARLLSPCRPHGDADPARRLANPDSTLLSQHTYNEMFTMHGSLMIYLFVGPVAFGGLRELHRPAADRRTDMAFPRLNALSYWLYLGGGSLMMTGFLTTGSAADFGWVAYAPLSNSINTPGAGPDLWIVALLLTGFSAIFTSVNLVSTIYYLRAPG